MGTPMYKIHEEVFNLLIEYHKKDPNFLFTIRQTNRYGRLDKGYWFHGNDKYLVVSFWSGRDWMRKIPRIGFHIWHTGDTSLFLSCKDLYKHDIFDYEMLNKLSIEPKDDKDGYVKYYKEFKGWHYLEALKRFIKTDKIIIDNALKGDYCINKDEWIERFDSVEFLNKKDFDKQLLKIREYKKKIKNELKSVGGLFQLKIENYLKIKKIEITNIPKECHWIFLTGENGSGKTTFLKALAFALCRNWDYQDQIIDTKTSVAKIKDIKVNLLIHKRRSTTESNTITLDSQIGEQKNISEGFAAYGAIRLLTSVSLEDELFNSEQNISERSTYGLFNPIGVLKDLSDSYPLFSKPKYLELTVDAFKENLKETLYDLLPENLSEENKHKLLDEFVGSKYILDELPSGTRSILTLIQDLLVRLQRQQPEVNDPGDYSGIVLIDEIDIHLHPKLQIKLVEQLSANFPNIQFIVSTHSPITLLGAPENSVFIKLSCLFNEEIKATRLNKLEKEIHQLLPNTILTSDIFDFDLYDQFEEEQFSELKLENKYDDIQKNKDVDERLSKLDKDIFPEDLFDNEKD